MDERPAKRPRGNYAKLICFNCRERRIKCQLLQDGSVQPSPNPQPPDKACQRCKQQSLECIVRKTTLGRPSNRPKSLPTPASTTPAEGFKSPSPEAEDLVLLQLDKGQSSHNKQAPRVGIKPTSAQLIRGIGKNVDLTSGLLARDPRFGSSIMQSRDSRPSTLTQILNEELVSLLDKHLVWQRTYIPWLPHLTSLYEEATKPDPEGGVATIFLTALLASIALDTPSERITRDAHQLRADLQNIVYHAGQNTLFTLPKHVNTINALVLIHGYRPLSLIHSHQAAAHTLTGKLYPTLIHAVQYQLDFHRALSKLYHCSNNEDGMNSPELVMQSLQWCSTLSFKTNQELEDPEFDEKHLDHLGHELERGLTIIATAIDRGLAPTGCIFIFYVIRYQADYSAAMRKLTASWNNLPRMTAIIDEYDMLCNSRKRQFDRYLTDFFYSKGRSEEGLVLAQLANMELNQGRTNALGLSMFFAIVYGAQKISAANKFTGEQTVVLTKYYTDALQLEARMGPDEKSDVRKFLDLYGDAHMDGLEKRLTDFINVASEVRLQGIPFVGPARHVTTNVLMACKEIVENNAVRIKLDKELHHRADTQLILFQEAARRLEGMEADGGTPEAVARGSIFAAAAKLVRSLHRIMSQWKRNYIAKQPEITHADQSHTPGGATPAESHDTSTTGAGNPADFDTRPFADDFLTDWQNWPHLDAVNFPSLLNFDFDDNRL